MQQEKTDLSFLVNQISYEAGINWEDYGDKQEPVH